MSNCFLWTAPIAFMLAGLSMSIMSCTPSGKGEQGQTIYRRHCAQCHGADGKGFRSLYPPLHGSTFFSTNRSSLPCIIRHGLRGNTILPDGDFNRTMPANSLLSVDDISDLMMYTSRFSQGNREAVPLTPENVREWLKNCP